MRPDPHRRRTLRAGQVAELTVIDTKTGERRVIYETGGVIEAPNWTPDGQWLIYNADGRLFKISPDGRTGPIRIDTSPIEDLNNDHCLAPDGQSIYLSANDGHLYAVPIAGGEPRKVSNDQDPARRHRYYLHGVSPDGRILAYVGLEIEDGKTVTRICTIPATGGADTILTDGACPVDGPEFSSDGHYIWFNSEAAAAQPGHAQIFRIPADGGDLTQITFDERVNWFPHVAPDGRTIAWLSFPPGTEGHPPDKYVGLKLMDSDGQNQRELAAFFGGQGTINVNSWAPDSRRLAYVAYPLRD